MKLIGQLNESELKKYNSGDKSVIAKYLFEDSFDDEKKKFMELGKKISKFASTVGSDSAKKEQLEKMKARYARKKIMLSDWDKNRKLDAKDRKESEKAIKTGSWKTRTDN